MFCDVSILIASLAVVVCHANLLPLNFDKQKQLRDIGSSLYLHVKNRYTCDSRLANVQAAAQFSGNEKAGRLERSLALMYTSCR